MVLKRYFVTVIKAQSARRRALMTLKKLYRVMVATDVAARGLDIGDFHGRN